MAAGNHGNGEGTPEDDDPFGYLYADGQAAGGGQGGYGYPGPAGAQPGRPRTSYNQVRAVGERPRGQVPPQPQYGQQHGTPYGQPHPQYAAPEAYPGGAPARPSAGVTTVGCRPPTRAPPTGMAYGRAGGRVWGS
ncbi:hypothetical protein ACE14D_13800, partial [Streptomyces sp. Act-28]